MASPTPLAPLVPTKLLAPQPNSAWVRREQLLDRLSMLQPTTRVTLVVAPAGFGKTTVVSQWLANVERRTQSVEQPDSEHTHPILRSTLYALRSAWLTLDEYDQDAAHFLAYVASAIKQILPDALPVAYPLLAAPEPPPLYVMLQALLVDLSALPAALTLVFDDYHMITAEPIHQVVAYLLRYLPATCHMVALVIQAPTVPVTQSRKAISATTKTTPPAMRRKSAIKNLRRER